MCRERRGVGYARDVDGGDFDEGLFFRSLFTSGARVLLIGRQARQRDLADISLLEALKRRTEG